MKKRVLTSILAIVIIFGNFGGNVVPVYADTRSGLIGHWNFDGNATNTITGVDAITTGSLMYDQPKSDVPEYVEGTNGKAVNFIGAGSDGLKLDVVPSSDIYSVSFNLKLYDISFATPVVFFAAGVEGDHDEQWVSISPMGISGFVQGTASVKDGPSIWSRNVHHNIVRLHVDPPTFEDGKEPMKLDVWQNWTVVCVNGHARIYLDGVLTTEGTISLALDGCETYLAVNNWDLPLNGAVDDLYIFDRELSEADITELTGFEISRHEALPPLEEDETTDSDAIESEGSISQSNNDDGLNYQLIIIIVAGVIMIGIVLAVVLKRKNKTS